MLLPAETSDMDAEAVRRHGVRRGERERSKMDQTKPNSGGIECLESFPLS